MSLRGQLVGIGKKVAMVTKVSRNKEWVYVIYVGTGDGEWLLTKDVT